MCTALEELEKDGIETEKFLPDMKTGSNQKKCKKGFCFCPPDILTKNNRIVVTESKNHQQRKPSYV